ncbi:MAG: anion permease [Phycisphaerales bacterium]|nr:anion permease [Phycisphaerales bacterium]
MSRVRSILVVSLAVGLFAGAAFSPWHDNDSLRRAVGIVLAVLVLWISEIAPLGVIALIVPVAATLSGVLKWGEALSAWGDPIVFLFLGTFLLARALEKHGVFERLGALHWARPGATEAGVQTGSSGGAQSHFGGGSQAGSVGRWRTGSSERTGSSAGVGALCMIVLLVSGAISTAQNNTAVTAMLLPVVATLARRTAAPALPLLALSYGATFGGMATPVGTAPNFLGFAKIQLVDPQFNFLTWLKVGIPVWIGTTVIGWGLLLLARRWTRAGVEETSQLGARVRMTADAREDGGLCDLADHRLESRCPSAAEVLQPHGLGDVRQSPSQVKDGDPSDPAVVRRSARLWAVGIFLTTAVIWLASGAVVSFTASNSPLQEWVKAYLPESLVPLAAALVLFIVRPRGGDRAVLDRADLQSLDWDTLFLIAGGLCLGKVLQSSGAADAVATSVAGANFTPLALMFALAGVTVLLSELTSNTATAALLVPLAGSLAEETGVPAVKLIWLVALSASLGFALPISTPPNAIVYGTRLIPLRLMAGMGLVVDALSVVWVVACVQCLA